MKTTIGGDRLGSGNKQNISMRNYERSTHDIGYIWRSSMASGTLVPFMSELALPGDSMDIDLDMNIMTLPTIGPLFGSYKVQADVFLVPMRIYNGKLHMNKLGIGNDMSRAKIPQIKVSALREETEGVIDDNMQINSSSLLSYLNIRGIGIADESVEGSIFFRYYNAIPTLGYWDIYKQYYANKQEERGFVVHTGEGDSSSDWVIVGAQVGQLGATTNCLSPTTPSVAMTVNTVLEIYFAPTVSEPPYDKIKVMLAGVEYPVFPTWDLWTWEAETNIMRFGSYNGTATTINVTVPEQTFKNNIPGDEVLRLVEFPLENIDTIKEDILEAVKSTTAFIIDEDTIAPYGLQLKYDVEESTFSQQKSQEGLGIKTYQSDLFNNWIDTEWIDGTGGVNEISAVSTAGDSFSIDALNLASKVYVMLNRIAISGGTYDDWLDAVYTHERAKSIETPVYMGSLIKELAFDEVVSNSASEDQPLGTLAGRGNLTGKTKGGKIRIKVDEPCYVMGIVSITPRLDYSQGNKWDTNLKTWNDLHKPALDAIGFQDLITDQMAWFDTTVNFQGTPTFKSAGKQPAWINYMTNVNQVRGSFAVKDDSMWMTLNRRYESEAGGGIKDLTTYVDPTKFNQIFADTRLDAQNFWVQIKVDNIARRKMSAKVIPNL